MACPIINDLEKTEIRFHSESLWWERTVKLIRTLRTQCDGKLLIAGPTLVSGLDALAALRGTENLLMDMITDPDLVKAALKSICKAYTDVSDMLYEEIGCKEYGSINRHGKISPLLAKYI